MNISPYILQTEFISIRWYGFLIALAILLSYYFSLKEARKQKIGENKFDTIFILTVLMGILGARIGFVIQNLNYFLDNPSKILAVWDGGLSIHGAIIIGSLGLYITSKANKIDTRTLANILSPYLLLSGAIGRWGNFFNKEIVGKPTDNFLKIHIPPENRPLGFERFDTFHPVFLYESALLMIAFILFLILKNKIRHYTLAYTLIAYSAIRIVVEFWRIDYEPIFYNLDLAQLVSFGIIIVTGVITLTFRKK